MPQLIIALIVFFGGKWLIKQFATATPQQAKSLNKKLAGGAAIGFSAFLALRGAYAFAVPLFVLGLGLLGKANPFPNGFNWGKKSEGQKSRVATSILAMELDHDSQTMTGMVLMGPFKDRNLEQLGTEDMQAFYQYCENANDQSVALLEAWLDRNKQDWRNKWTGERKTQNSGNAAMSRDEAFAVLGLKADATPQDIKDAHRRLMKEFHPDRGGSDYLAAKINQAKDVLLQD